LIVSRRETNPTDFEIGHGLDGLEDPKIFEAFSCGADSPCPESGNAFCASPVTYPTALRRHGYSRLGTLNDGDV
jgi:hypothetical protein